MDQVRTTTGLRGIDVAHPQAEIIDHWPGTARSVAGAEIAVDIGLAQPGVFDRAPGDFGMQLRGGFVGRIPGWMLVNPGDIGLALDAQYGAPLAFFFSSGFLTCQRGLGKRRNIPSGETGVILRCALLRASKDGV